MYISKFGIIKSVAICISKNILKIFITLINIIYEQKFKSN